MAIDISILDDAGLANLRANAERLGATGDGSARQQEAAQLLPLIQAELTRRAEEKSKTAAARKATTPAAAKPKKKSAAKD